MVTKKEIENKAFNDALSESLEKTFSGEFSSVIKSEGLVGEKFKGQHSKLLDLVGDNTQQLAKAKAPSACRQPSELQSGA